MPYRLSRNIEESLKKFLVPQISDANESLTKNILQKTEHLLLSIAKGLTNGNGNAEKSELYDEKRIVCFYREPLKL